MATPATASMYKVRVRANVFRMCACASEPLRPEREGDGGIEGVESVIARRVSHSSKRVGMNRCKIAGG